MFQAVESYVSSILSIDKIKIVMTVTWLWAWVGIYTTKCFECVFKLVLSVPDSWLKHPSDLCRNISTTQNKKINILDAHNDMGVITNKFKIFLQYYWENGGNGNAHDTNGFSMHKFTDLLNCSLLYCSYCLSNNAENTTPETFFKDVHNVFVEKQSDNCYQTNDKVLSDKHPIFMGHTTLDDEKLAEEDINLSDMELDDVENTRNSIVQDIINNIENRSNIPCN
jgi:hypothetical protein